MKILITGGSGQVGFELCRTLAPLGPILAPNRQALNLDRADDVAAYLERHRPDLIVNAAAFTAVDAAESQREAAERLNVGLPLQLATHAREHGVPLVHYSSDYVYPGNGDTAWQEGDATGPLSHYGATKLQGDEAIQQSGAAHLILRTSWVYSARGRNFLDTMLRLGRERERLSIVDDQIGAPTPARLIATVTLLALREWQRGALEGGLYHLASRGEASWHEFASEIFRQAIAAGEPLAISPEAVSAIPTRDYPTPAPRPLNSRLAVDKLETALGITLPDWQTQLALTLEEYLAP
ncbi:dTDP-4-dehydrorhamnose reductase [Salinicola sp. V024]|uniref:dTDP-4-dehydrorhamnose reductase n=1 Tax=Salinicola sp. V024 TaxID=3459609 RepID=UPI004044F75D